MSFQQSVKVPKDRIGALIGKSGKAKSMIEESCGVKLEVDSEYGDVVIRDAARPEEMQPFKAVELVTAIAKGFSPQRANRLLVAENILHLIDLKDFVGKSGSALERIKGRIIGADGKARRTMEQLTGTYISIYGHNVAIIGNSDEIRLASEAIAMLANGSMHKSVYNMLQEARRKTKLERLKLWEDKIE